MIPLFCPQCGAPIPEDANFCTNCGTPVSHLHRSAPVQMKKRKKKSKFFLILLLLLLALAVLWLFSGDDEDDYYDDDFGYSSYDGYDDDNNSYGDETGSHGTSSHTQSPSTAGLGFRDHYVDTASAESVTMMVYMIGSDLESENGCGTMDIQEMSAADLGNVRIALQTGGCSMWQSGEIGDRTVQRFVLDDSGMEFQSDLGKISMVQPSTLTSFIQWAKQACPADRYILVLWDHGGGTTGGFGSDELFGDKALSLEQLYSALHSANTKFDIIGFDACLMATVETAYAMEPYADYLLASEEYEPGTGWAYTNFLSRLNKNPAMDSVALCKLAIDDFHKENDGGDITLSVVDLAGIAGVYENLSNFLANAKRDIQADNSRFSQLSKAISKARTYCDRQIDQIDMLDMVQKTDFQGKQELMDAVRACVRYHNDSALTGSNGLAMYFPYSQKETYSSSRAMLNGIHFTDPVEYYNYFLSIMSSNRNRSGNQVISAQEEDFSNQSWYEKQDDFDYGDEYDDLVLTETREGFVLQESDAFWDRINDIELQVMIDDHGRGYWDLGSDNAEIWTDDGDLLLDFDYMWVSINGHIVPFYANPSEVRPDDSVVYSGKVYAELNGETKIALEIKWEPQDGTIENLKARVVGYRDADNGSTTYGKGLKTLRAGDRLVFLQDYYPGNENADPVSRKMDFSLTVKSQDALKVEYTELQDCTVICWYHMTDIYGSDLYTEIIELTVE